MLAKSWVFNTFFCCVREQKKGYHTGISCDTQNQNTHQPDSAINFDLTQLDTAATLADEMRNLLAQVNGEDTKKEEKTIRDQAYTLLKETVDRVRKAGKYALRKDKNRLEGYFSNHWKKY